MTATANTLFDPGLLSGGENNYNILRNQTLTPLNIPVGIADTLFAMNATAGALTVNLPRAAAVPDGTEFVFKKIDSSANAITVNVASGSSDLIDGASSTTITTQWAFKRMVCDGVSAWVLT